MSLPPKNYNYWSGADDQSLFDPHRLPLFLLILLILPIKFPLTLLFSPRLSHINQILLIFALLIFPPWHELAFGLCYRSVIQLQHIFSKFMKEMSLLYL